MMTEDIYRAISSNDVNTLRKVMNIGTPAYDIQLWEGTKIWPRITRRLTAVQLAVREGSGKVLKVLVEEAKLDVNYGQASTALTTAMEYNRMDMIHILIEQGVQVNKAIIHGYGGMGEGYVSYSFPIHMAVCQDNPAYLRMLLQYGADPLREYSDLSSVNKYQTTIALVEAVKRERHLHATLMLQTIPTLTQGEPGINDLIFDHVKTAFICLALQEKSEVLLGLLIEFAGNQVMKNTCEIKVNPLKLKQVCRRTIRKSYSCFLKGEDKNRNLLMEVVKRLPLPRLLVNYLMLEEEVQLLQ